jgi:2-polyprenyl-6-methoxyphenol hydroxylase-like FAD-dependent oxidoreductase
MPAFKAIIIGAGLGGLCLAQALRRDGIDFEIFERDKGAFDRPQGYRLHLDEDAINAAKEVLPPHLYALFEATSHWTDPFTTILGTDLSVVKRMMTQDDLGEAAWPAASGAPVHANVDRATLRQILLAALDGAIRYDKALDHYESGSAGVVAYFTDGTTATGSVLVGADGVHSAVRRQRAADCEIADAGITAIYGRVSLAAASPLVPKETLEDIFTIASDERKVFLGLGAVRFPTPPEAAAACLAPGVSMRAQDDYVVGIVGGRREHLSATRGASGAELQEIAAKTIEGWVGEGSALIRAGDAAAFFAVEMFTSVPCSLDAPSNVTLLGDAIHAMTPTLGRGANVAMRDGVLLGRALRRVVKGESPLDDALAAYETEMLDYGFAVVREAAEIGRQRMAQNPLPA